jgi:carbohydrate-selective porin OprB
MPSFIRRTIKPIIFLVFFCIPALSLAIEPLERPQPLDIAKVFVSREELAQKYGFEYAFLFNYTQNLILNGTHDDGKSLGFWYWDLELSQRLWKGGKAFIELEMDKNKGIDKLVPTFSWFNYNSTDNASPYIPVYYLTQELWGEKFFLVAGKTDPSNWFDTNAVAGSADTQFQSAALVNNLILPFPIKSIGVLANFKPGESWYFQAGASTATTTPTKTGLSNAFADQVFLAEFGLTPKWKGLAGNYRFIFCSDRQNLDYINAEGVRRNNYSFALSFDQALTERISLFARYGQADPKVKNIEYFWSAGGQLIEPIPGRKEDCLAFGVAQSMLGNDYLQAYGPGLSSTETMYELYYSVHLKDYLFISPNLQYVAHPDVGANESEALACGVRFLLIF